MINYGDEKKIMSDREITILKKELKIKEYRIEELEQQLAYECECNKQFVECQNKVEKLEQQLKDLPKKIIAEIYDLAYDKFLGYDGEPKTTEINFLSLENILEQVQKKYTKEQKK